MLNFWPRKCVACMSGFHYLILHACKLYMSRLTKKTPSEQVGDLQEQLVVSPRVIITHCFVQREVLSVTVSEFEKT